MQGQTGLLQEACLVSPVLCSRGVMRSSISQWLVSLLVDLSVMTAVVALQRSGKEFAHWGRCEVPVEGGSATSAGQSRVSRGRVRSPALSSLFQKPIDTSKQ